MRGKIIYGLLLILLSTSSFALVTTVSTDKSSVSLNHGQSTTVSFQISHDNSWCDVICSYYLKDVNSGKKIQESSVSLSPGQYLTKTYTLYAPSKSSGGDSGSLQYEFSATCSDSNACLIKDAPDPDDKFFVINYDLTSTEKSAKSYLETNLEKLKTKLETLEKSIYNINSRINALEDNVLVGNIPSSINSVESNFDVVKSNRDTVKSYYDAHNYIDGKSVFKESWITNSEAYNSNIQNLNDELDDIIKKHNAVASSINSLNKELDALGKDSKVLKEETKFNELSQSLSTLSNKFEKGNFVSYDSITTEINTLNNQIKEFSTKLKKLSSTLVTQISSSVKSEYDSLCSIKNYCQNAPIISTNEAGKYIEEFCGNKLNLIKNDFDKGNDQVYEEYLTELDNINNKNEEILTLNEKLKEYYNISNSLINILNDNLVQINYEECVDIDLNSSLTEIENAKNKCDELLSESENQINTNQGFIYSIKLFIKKLNPFGKIKNKKFNFKEKLELPIEPTNLDFSLEFKELSSKYCSIDLKLAPRSYSNVNLADNPEGKTLTRTSISELTKQTSKCCTFGICKECCEGTECLNDATTYPVIFLHGHSFKEWDSTEYSLDAFNSMINSLKDEGFISGGTITPSTPYGTAGEWGKAGAPVMVKTTYYIGVYNENGQLISAQSKSESIETYASRLKNMIEKVKYKTNRNKVIIVAHSMGGLVAREYIKEFGDDSIYKLIMIGTPNHGVYGEVDGFCNLFGADIECTEMSNDSDFIKSLNSGDETPGNTKYYTIKGSGCVLSGIDGDGIVRSTSVPLDGATNYEIKGVCSGTFNRDFHSDLLNPSKYPEVLTKLKSIIKG